MTPQNPGPKKEEEKHAVLPQLSAAHVKKKSRWPFGGALLQRMGIDGQTFGVFSQAAGKATAPLWGSKAGIVAFTLATVTLAAGVSVLVKAPSNRVVRIAGGPGMFPAQHQGEDSMEHLAAQDRRVAPGVMGAPPLSLDFVRGAGGREAGASGEIEESAPVDDPGWEDSLEPSASDAPAAAAETEVEVRAPSGGGRLAPMKGTALSSKLGGGQSRATLSAQAGLSGGIGGQFKNKLPRNATPVQGMKKGPRVTMTASRRGPVNRARRASKQLVNTNRVVQGHSKRSEVSSAGYGTTYDGAQTSEAGAISGDGVDVSGDGAGPDGVDQRMANPDTLKDLKDVPPPEEAEGDNATPYQAKIQRAMMAMMIAGALLMVATMLKKNPKTAGMAKMVAGLAAMAGAYAAFLGFQIMQEDGQKQQGMIWVLIGGAIAAMAAKIMMEDADCNKSKGECGAAAAKGGEGIGGKLGAAAACPPGTPDCK